VAQQAAPLQRKRKKHRAPGPVEDWCCSQEEKSGGKPPQSKMGRSMLRPYKDKEKSAGLKTGHYG
jgi:hypothetical protein